MSGPTLMAACVAIVLAAPACGRRVAGEPVPVADLIHTFDRAEKRPPAGFDLRTHVAGGIPRAAIVMPVPSRVIWPMPLPHHGVFRAQLALPTPPPGAVVRFRFGVSDQRIYDAIASETLSANQTGWTSFQADLSYYAGFKWSIFYRPDRMTWRVVLATDMLGAGPVDAAWGTPEIVTDHRSAMEYASRRQTFR